MKASEKKILYNLFKTASDNYYGYSSPEYNSEINFLDDVEIQKIKTQPEQKENNAEKHVSFDTEQSKTDEISEIRDETEENSSEKNKSHSITMHELSEKIKACKNCELCTNRNNSVPGQGVEHPAVLVIGEGPGEEEDKQGLPFVGPAGQLLDKMLASIQLDRNINCYIANTVKCRPPYNRDPSPEEAAACRSFLDAQIHILKPKIILLVGKVALRNLMNIQGEISLRRYRGQIYEYNGIPLIVTYHPSALLRNADYKRPAWEDLKFFKTKLLELMPDYAKNFPQQ